MSHERYDINLENFSGNNSEVDRLENEVEAANKKAKTLFESMKRVAHENNTLREENEKLKNLMKDFACFAIVMEESETTEEPLTERIERHLEKFMSS